MMQTIKQFHRTAKVAYDAGQCPTDAVRQAGICALRKLSAEANPVKLGNVLGKEYSAFAANQRLSRPYLPTLFISTPDSFCEQWDTIIESITSTGQITSSAESINRLLYTSIASYSICFDLWNPGARKTPGTFFEIALGSIIGRLLPNHVRSKFIPIPGETERVSTDIVFRREGSVGGLVIPAKITTRERIVQPYAHQRILDSVVGDGVYKSVLVCMSETQRDGENNVNEICVPGTIHLFQRHLASLDGIFYLDPPFRYLQPDVTDILHVGTVGELLTRELSHLS